MVATVRFFCFSSAFNTFRELRYFLVLSQQLSNMNVTVTFIITSITSFVKVQIEFSGMGALFF